MNDQRTTYTAPERLPEEQPAGPTVIAERVVYYIVGVIVVLLAFRFFLSLFGANRGNPFADLIYDVTFPLVQPFFTLFNYNMQYGISRLEFETLFAMFVYAAIGAGIAALIRLPRRNRDVS